MTSVTRMIAAVILGYLILLFLRTCDDLCNTPASACPFQLAKLLPRKLARQGYGLQKCLLRCLPSAATLWHNHFQQAPPFVTLSVMPNCRPAKLFAALPQGAE